MPGSNSLLYGWDGAILWQVLQDFLCLVISSLMLGQNTVFAALSRIAWTPWCADPRMSNTACLSLVGITTALSHSRASPTIDSLSLCLQNSLNSVRTSDLSSG